MFDGALLLPSEEREDLDAQRWRERQAAQRIEVEAVAAEPELLEGREVVAERDGRALELAACHADHWHEAARHRREERHWTVG